MALPNGTNPVNRLREEMDRLFGDFLRGLPVAGPTSNFTAAGGYPALNIWEENDCAFRRSEFAGSRHGRS